MDGGKVLDVEPAKPSDKNANWKAYEPHKVTSDQRQVELKNFAAKIPRKNEKSNSRALPAIKKGAVPDRKSAPVPIVAQSSRYAQPKVTISPPKKQEQVRMKSGPIPKVRYPNQKVSGKRVMNHIFDPNRPENNPVARKKKEMAGRSFAQEQHQEPEKMVVKWHPHRRNPDGQAPIQVELDDCILDGLPVDMVHESEPMSRVVLAILAEILSLRDRVHQLELGGAGHAVAVQQTGSAADFVSGEMARAMQEAAENALRNAKEAQDKAGG